MIEEYYKPSDIHYSRKQNIWLLKNVLFQDKWPSDHKETGYTGNIVELKNYNAPFEMIRMVIGELSARLRLCGKAGLYFEYMTLIDYEDEQVLEARLAGYHQTTPGEVHFLANMAMRYCCGYKRKRVTFKDFCYYTKSSDNHRRKKKGERTNPPPYTLG